VVGGGGGSFNSTKSTAVGQGQVGHYLSGSVVVHHNEDDCSSQTFASDGV
jgi:hypothetical protein